MITIKELAKIAGVSYSTVSKALNNYPDIGEETKKRVLELAKEYNYSPNTSAQNLSSKTKRNIALIISNLDQVDDNDNLSTKALQGAISGADFLGYDLLVFPINSKSQKTKSYYTICQENNIMGAILSGIKTDDQYFIELANSEIPYVLIDIYAEGNHSSSISVDNVEASREAVNYLIKQGHTNIGIMNGKLNSIVGIERYAGYIQALLDNGIVPKKEYSFDANFDENLSYTKTKEALIVHPEITAFFCASDVMAIGMYRAARELGIKIPNQLSIIGFDDLPVSKHLSPPLTTIKQDFYKFGYKSVTLLLDLIKYKKGKHFFEDYQLIIRESVINRTNT